MILAERLPRLRSAGALIVLVVFAAGGAYAWQTLYPPCEVKAVEEASALLISQMRQYDDVYQSAAAAPSRTATIYPVAVMQRIMADTRQIDVPACMDTAKDELLGYMGDAIRAFHAYAAQQENTVIQGWLDSSHAHVREFIRELDVVKTCAPYCLP